MLFATFLGVLLIPVFYVFVRRLLGDKLEGAEETLAATKDPNAHG
jgi:multidrug efflux pump